jgi:hypothetical protein
MTVGLEPGRSAYPTGRTSRGTHTGHRHVRV